MRTREGLLSFLVKNRLTSALIEDASVFVGEAKYGVVTSGRVSLDPEVVDFGFTVRAVGYEPKVIGPWGIEAGGTILLNPLIRLSGRTTHQTRGLEGVSIIFMALPPEKWESSRGMKLHPIQGRCTSDNDGRFVLPAIPYGYRVSIEAQKIGYTARESTLFTKSPPRPFEIEMERGAILHLNVKGLVRPIPLQIRLQGRRLNYDKDWSSAYVEYASGGDGSIDMTVLPGEYHLELLTEGRRFHEIDLNIKDEAFIDVNPAPDCPRYQVKVVESGRGDGVYNARVEFGAYTYKTSVHGECSFPAPDEMPKTIVVTKGGYFPSVSELSSTGVNTVVLEKAPLVPVRFVSEEGRPLYYRGTVTILPRSEEDPIDVEGDSGTWQSLPLGRIGVRLDFDDGSRSRFMLNLVSGKSVVVALRRFKGASTPVYVLERWIDGSERLVGTVRSRPLRIPVRKNATYRALDVVGDAMRGYRISGKRRSSWMRIASYILPEVRLDPPVFVDLDRSLLYSFSLPSGWWRATYLGQNYLVHLGRGSRPIAFDWTRDYFRTDPSSNHVEGDLMLLHRLEGDKRVVGIDHIDVSSEMIPVAMAGDVVAVTRRGNVRIWRTHGFSDADSFEGDFDLTQERRIVFKSRDSGRSCSVDVSLVIPGREDFPPIVVLRRLMSTGECLRFYSNRTTEFVLSWSMDCECRTKRVLPIRLRQDLIL